MQAVGKGKHALATAVDSARTCPYSCVVTSKDGWIALCHSLGDTPMLPGTKGCEFSPIPTGILPYLLQTLANALTKWSKVTGITELLQYPLIALVVR